MEFDNLPQEIIYHIILYLPPTSLLSFIQTSHEWWRLWDNQDFWKGYIKINYPRLYTRENTYDYVNWRELVCDQCFHELLERKYLLYEKIYNDIYSHIPKWRLIFENFQASILLQQPKFQNIYCQVIAKYYPLIHFTHDMGIPRIFPPKEIDHYLHLTIDYPFHHIFRQISCKLTIYNYTWRFWVTGGEGITISIHL